MSSSAAQQLDYNLVNRGIVSLGSGESSVIDTRGCTYLTCFAASGTHTARPCNQAGTNAPGSANLNFTVGTPIAVSWPFYKVTAVGVAADFAAG